MSRTEGGDYQDVWPVTLEDIDRSLRLIASELARVADYLEALLYRRIEGEVYNGVGNPPRVEP